MRVPDVLDVLWGDQNQQVLGLGEPSPLGFRFPHRSMLQVR
jgi:hypothetical protein